MSTQVGNQLRCRCGAQESKVSTRILRIHISTYQEEMLKLGSKVSRTNDVIFDARDIIDDIWISIFCFSNSKHFVHVSHCCKHFNSLTSYKKQLRIKYYWQLQCARLSSEIKIDTNYRNPYGPNNMYKQPCIDINWIQVYQDIKNFIHNEYLKGAQITINKNDDPDIELLSMTLDEYLENGVSIEDAISLQDCPWLRHTISNLLYTVTEQGHLALFKVLLCNMMAEDKDFNINSIPYHINLKAKDDINININIDADQYFSPLYISISEHNRTIAGYMLAIENYELFVDKLKLNVSFNHEEINKMRKDMPIIYSVFYGDYKLTKLLLNHPTMTKESINDRDTEAFRKCAFYHACDRQNYEITKLLLNDERVDVNLVDNKGIPPLVAAIRLGGYNKNNTSFDKDTDRMVRLLLQTDENRLDYHRVLNYLNGKHDDVDADDDTDDDDEFMSFFSTNSKETESVLTNMICTKLGQAETTRKNKQTVTKQEK